MASVSAETLRLVFAEFAPYQYMHEGQATGRGVTAIREIIERDLGLELSLDMYPNYGRAVKATEQGKADGFFLASQNSERDAIAEFSLPVMFNNWSWFFHRRNVLDNTQPQFHRMVRVATLLHTNTHKWLEKNSFRHIMPVMKPSLLPTLLELERVDAVFLAEVVFSAEVEALGLQADDFVQVVEVAKPFGIYISKRYLAEHPDFMSKLNAAIARYNNTP
ncbi:substrate-binding periplasmic protein [Agaribacterium haliotis]|uniref:substrate-binding periplasmic protein n=1 Tax=Agaribacterium haliotis TaxID=2013869 RepID=UPI00130403C5|nr:transporter substrate-binding domain-containing protein [Agaribacterium haliotis]